MSNLLGNNLAPYWELTVKECIIWDMKGFGPQPTFTEKPATELHPHEVVSGVGIVQRAYIHRYGTPEEFDYAINVYRRMLSAQRQQALFDSMICIPETNELIFPHLGPNIQQILQNDVVNGTVSACHVSASEFKHFAYVIEHLPQYMRPFDLGYGNLCIWNGVPIVIDIEAQWSVAAGALNYCQRGENDRIENVQESLVGLALSLNLPFEALTKSLQETTSKEYYEEYLRRRNLLFEGIHCILIGGVSENFTNIGVDCVSLHTYGDLTALRVGFKDGSNVAFNLRNSIFAVGRCESPARRAKWLEHGRDIVGENLYHYVFFDLLDDQYDVNAWKAYYVVT